MAGNGQGAETLGANGELFVTAEERGELSSGDAVRRLEVGNEHVNGRVGGGVVWGIGGGLGGHK
jgi:hypothetical protein